jgi:hypothetical protein
MNERNDKRIKERITEGWKDRKNEWKKERKMFYIRKKIYPSWLVLFRHLYSDFHSFF